MNNLIFRKATLKDVQAAATLHALEKDTAKIDFEKMFLHEFSACVNSPEKRVYYLAFSENELISYAGARLYEPLVDENMYGTLTPLPAGWYLRGIKVHPQWRRKGLARSMTLKRLEWIKKRASQCYVFLDDENKVTLPMYFDLGFNEVSKGWGYSDPRRASKNTKGILLQVKI